MRHRMWLRNGRPGRSGLRGSGSGGRKGDGEGRREDQRDPKARFSTFLLHGARWAG